MRSEEAACRIAPVPGPPQPSPDYRYEPDGDGWWDTGIHVRSTRTPLTSLIAYATTA
ncbi:MAG: hypothetical protein MUQ27_00285 [Acidimicrobiia bacterium]|nr:hypothetical protein [Acidimicrobiia bacterium]